MSRTLFDVPTPQARRAARGGMVFGSIVAHGAVLFLIVAVQFGAIESPAVARSLELFVVPKELPVPPPPARPNLEPARPAPASPNSAPAEAPDWVAPEPAAPVPEGPGVPGAIAVGGNGTPWSIGDGRAGTALTAPPPPASPVPTVVRIGGDIKAPARLTYVTPVYPAVAQAAKVQGTVILEATIDERGIVRDVRVTQSIPLLDQAAVNAVSKWRYTPTRLNGVAVPVIMTVRVAFSLN